MITILPADEAFLKSVQAPADAQAMVLREADDRVTGYALFRYDRDAVDLLAVQAEEPVMVDGLIRSVLNVGYIRGIETGICRVAGLEKVLIGLEFVKTEKAWTVSIPDFFNLPCPNCQKNT